MADEKKTQKFEIRVGPNTLKKLDERAAQERRPRSQLARMWIEDILEGKCPDKRRKRV